MKSPISQVLCLIGLGGTILALMVAMPVGIRVSGEFLFPVGRDAQPWSAPSFTTPDPSALVEEWTFAGGGGGVGLTDDPNSFRHHPGMHLRP